MEFLLLMLVISALSHSCYAEKKSPDDDDIDDTQELAIIDRVGFYVHSRA